MWRVLFRYISVFLVLLVAGAATVEGREVNTTTVKKDCDDINLDIYIFKEQLKVSKWNLVDLRRAERRQRGKVKKLIEKEADLQKRIKSETDASDRKSLKKELRATRTSLRKERKELKLIWKAIERAEETVEENPGKINRLQKTHKDHNCK
ncbi:MAG: hypothetical protein GY952_12550 [Rhodobacteraceae bacterium]|nr:hypothetical protein [Paracoccaceae bacterium]